MFLNYSLALGIHGSGEIPDYLQNRIQLRNRFSADVNGEDNTVAGIKPRECSLCPYNRTVDFFLGSGYGVISSFLPLSDHLPGSAVQAAGTSP